VTTVGPFDFAEIQGITFDGTNIWVSRFGGSDLLRLDSAGGVLQTVPLGEYPRQAVFDDANLWVPMLPVSSQGGSVAIVAAAGGKVVATLTGNGLENPFGASFDGERVLITNGDSTVSVWRAADLEPLGTTSTTTGPGYPCSDGINFWLPLGAGQLARF
jgi:DNA-binding beta-propeller fold protein YncE